jgi:hypothetical protein
MASWIAFQTAFGIVEDHRHPAAGLQHPAVLLEAALHQVLVIGESFLLSLVDDGVGCRIGQHAVPGFDHDI